jgi:hypothetical protein
MAGLLPERGGAATIPAGKKNSPNAVGAPGAGPDKGDVDLGSLRNQLGVLSGLTGRG